MTTHYDNAGTQVSVNTFEPFYAIAQHARYHLHRTVNSVKEPEREYGADLPTSDPVDTYKPDITTLQDRLEEHLGRYHFHQLSLLAIGSNDDYKDNDDWEFGAFLSGRQLKNTSEALMKELSRATLSTKVRK